MFQHDELSEVDSDELIECFMEIEGSPLDKIQSLKEKGNKLFKNNKFSEATNFYNKACQILCFVVQVMNDYYEIEIISSLAMSLNLNLAACALKLIKHETVKNLCSLVLSSFSHNINVLFHRVLAFMRLKMFSEAKMDLEKGLVIEPKNKIFS